jgi:hypothetical protein
MTAGSCGLRRAFMRSNVSCGITFGSILHCLFHITSLIDVNVALSHVFVLQESVIERIHSFV